MCTPWDEALKGVDLVIEGTEPVAIIGQNGAGKTTLVKHFNGILDLPPVSLINGEDINNRSTAQVKGVGYVFQNPDQIFLETIRIRLDLQIGMPRKIKEQMDFVSELCLLKDKLDLHPFDLTLTEKKFCTIGSIIMMDPKVIIFDEPTCGQDVEGNKRLKNIVKTLQDMGKLCITISHDMKFVVENFRRVIVMCKGKVLLDGDSKEVFSQVDKLKQSFVSPPPITRVAQKAGFKETVFNIDEFMREFDNRKEK